MNFTVRGLRPWTFHLYYALLLGTYAAVMLGLFRQSAGRSAAARRWPIFLALFVLVHSAVLRWGSSHWLGNDYPWFFQAGVAGQYILGPVLQPSAFGVLLVAAVYLFVQDRVFLAAGAAALAATAHCTYLLPAALLFAGFQAALLFEKRTRLALAVGGVALLLVLPITAYVLVNFGPTTREAFAQAQAIMVNIRIPHHTRVDLWLDPVAGLQIVWMIVGTVLARPDRSGSLSRSL